VILYADSETDSMRRAIDETNRRRVLQEDYNREHGVTPQTVRKAIQESLIEVCEADYVTVPLAAEEEEEYRTAEDLARAVGRLRKEMREAAQALEFERAAELRDRLQHLEARELEMRTGVAVS
jgi:excinuclease ABC subunit B